MRSGLLCGTGGELADVVAKVLRAAGFTVTDLDEDLSATKSADLLAVSGAGTCLIEVKSAAGAAVESPVSHLNCHLTTWPQLPPAQPVTCAAPVVNHQHKLERTREVYQRAQLVCTLTFLGTEYR
ncbi:hypothetical protein ACIQCJ_07960 [Streptomyces sp. NPDC093221]|uniref:hypothetical protein n=1 Tax=Streptomyces sp. NPDC093221 TaxID=3366032 RepID=UPI0037FFB221